MMDCKGSVEVLSQVTAIYFGFGKLKFYVNIRKLIINHFTPGLRHIMLAPRMKSHTRIPKSF